jgi:hypothetical protein
MAGAAIAAVIGILAALLGGAIRARRSRRRRRPVIIQLDARGPRP